MKHLAPFALIPLSAILCSCGLVGKVIQAPIRLLQAAGRTVTDAGETTSPATREAGELHELAAKVAEGATE